MSANQIAQYNAQIAQIDSTIAFLNKEKLEIVSKKNILVEAERKVLADQKEKERQEKVASEFQKQKTSVVLPKMESNDHAQIITTGLVGDRDFAVIGEDGRMLTARECPMLLEVEAKIMDDMIHFKCKGEFITVPRKKTVSSFKWEWRLLRQQRRSRSCARPTPQKTNELSSCLLNSCFSS